MQRGNDASVAHTGQTCGLAACQDLKYSGKLGHHKISLSHLLEPKLSNLENKYIITSYSSHNTGTLKQRMRNNGWVSVTRLSVIHFRG